jgi:hypothetical protein
MGQTAKRRIKTRCHIEFPTIPQMIVPQQSDAEYSKDSPPMAVPRPTERWLLRADQAANHAKNSAALLLSRFCLEHNPFQDLRQRWIHRHHDNSETARARMT